MSSVAGAEAWSSVVDEVQAASSAAAVPARRALRDALGLSDGRGRDGTGRSVRMRTLRLEYARCMHRVGGGCKVVERSCLLARPEFVSLAHAEPPERAGLAPLQPCERAFDRPAIRREVWADAPGLPVHVRRATLDGVTASIGREHADVVAVRDRVQRAVAAVNDGLVKRPGVKTERRFDDSQPYLDLDLNYDKFWNTSVGVCL